MQYKVWSKTQIHNHEEAAKKLGLIKDEVRDFLHASVLQNTSITESDAIKFIKNTYKKHGLVNDHKKEFCIVAFRKNTKEVHYFPKGKGSKLSAPSLVLLDLLGRINTINTPYADATFMFYLGEKIPKEIQKTWQVLVKSRDKAIEYIRKEIKKVKYLVV